MTFKYIYDRCITVKSVGAGQNVMHSLASGTGVNFTAVRPDECAAAGAAAAGGVFPYLTGVA